MKGINLFLIKKNWIFNILANSLKMCNKEHINIFQNQNMRTEVGNGVGKATSR